MRSVYSSRKSQGRGKEVSLLVEDDVSQNHLAAGVKKVNLIALLCPRVSKKDVFNIMRDEFGEGRRVILDKECASKDFRREGKE